MNTSIFKGNWHEIKGKIKQKWGKITDDELLQIEGNHEELYGALQKHYGYAKEDAKKFIDEL